HAFRGQAVDEVVVEVGGRIRAYRIAFSACAHARRQQRVDRERSEAGSDDRIQATHLEHVTLRGDRTPAYLVNPRDEELQSELRLLDPSGDYGRFENRDVKLEIIGADTGENGFFSIGEFQAITYPRQMEYVTPEEVART